jgi:hypothetical protein|nr:MAG TPA: hypothetical protein [Caudoviricetes sp.]
MRQDKRALFQRMQQIQSWNGKLDEDEKRDLSLFAWLSLDWAKREPNRQAVLNIVSVCNLALVLANKEYPKGYMGEANTAFAVVLANLKLLISRGKEKGTWSLNGDLIRNLPVVLSLHDRQLTEVSRKVMEACVNYVRENV